jgi:hypothetical protein
MSQAVADRVSSWLTALHALRDDDRLRSLSRAPASIFVEIIWRLQAHGE